MKLFLISLAMLINFSAWAVNNDIAKGVCNSFQQEDYPGTFKKCHEIVSKGNFNAVAVQTCIATTVTSTPMDRVTCLENIRNVRFDNRAATACLKLGKSFYSKGVVCLQNTGNKEYENDEAEACENASAECWEKSGTSIKQTPGW